jgi:predicted O-methyltransferase YrrM
MDGAALERVRELTAPEDETTTTARERAGRTALPSPEVGSLLRWLALSGGVRSAVEVGSAGGVSGLWLVGGMAARGVLTTIDDDPHTHGLATEAFTRAGLGPRVRAILGAPGEVLPRLSDAAYDLVVLQGSAFATVDPLEHARRLLHPGGVLVALGLLASGDHADARARFVQALADDPTFAAVVLPVDEGVALATRQEDVDEDAAEGAVEA